jgi:DNA-binding NtrC family response regulator
MTAIATVDTSTGSNSDHSQLKGRILVVDDHATARDSMTDILMQAGHRVTCLSSAVEALEHLESTSFDVVITDLRMPGMSGLDFVRELSRRKHGAQAIMVTAHASVSTAVEAMRYGAFDYLEKPFPVEQLEDVVSRALRQGRFLDRTGFAGDTSQVHGSMIGTSRPMQEFRAKLRQVAETLETVLIIGESGTGKELTARAVHDLSARRDRPLVSLNCPALSAQLMESELFGHERGAFTGADAPRVGRFELADGGTILLDEVTEIELPLQAKLLRVLQERSFERVGSSHTRQVDVRVLATTNRDLREQISSGRLREDLYYRLAVLPLHVPPLRERKGDVPLLVEHFRARAAARSQHEPCQISAPAHELLQDYHWPGNVRELENVITRACVLYAGREVYPDDLRPWLIQRAGVKVGNTADGIPVGLSLHDMERKLIEATLDHFAGHREKAAKALGIGIRTLSGKLREYGHAPRAKRFTQPE